MSANARISEVSATPSEIRTQLPMQSEGSRLSYTNNLVLVNVEVGKRDLLASHELHESHVA